MQISANHPIAYLVSSTMLICSALSCNSKYVSLVMRNVEVEEWCQSQSHVWSDLEVITAAQPPTHSALSKDSSINSYLTQAVNLYHDYRQFSTTFYLLGF